jgi:hypothetical protein
VFASGSVGMDIHERGHYFIQILFFHLALLSHQDAPSQFMQLVHVIIVPHIIRYDLFVSKATIDFCPLTKVAQMLNRHIDGLLAYVRYKVTNASVEGLNSLIRQIKSNAKGFRRFENFRIAVLILPGKLYLSPQTSP